MTLRLDHIRNEDIRKEAHIKPVETFLENKTLIKWFGHCLRREHNHICAKSLRLEVSGRRSRGRPKKRWRDNIKGDTKKYQLTEDRKYWMTKIMAGPAQGDGRECRWRSRGSLDDLRVKLRDAVDSVTADDGEMSHVDTLLRRLLNEGHTTHTVLVCRPLGSDNLQIDIVLDQ